MDMSFMFFIGAAVLWAVISTAFVVFMCVSLVKDDKRDATDTSKRSLVAEKPLAVLLRQIILVSIALIPLLSLVAGALAFGLVHAVQWMGQNLSLTLLVASVVLAVMASVTRQPDSVVA